MAYYFSCNECNHIEYFGYLGLKVADGQSVLAGTIILKQRGTKFHPGFNVRRANDDSLFATCDGLVKFSRKGRNRKTVNIINQN